MAINPQELKNVLSQAVSETIENMAFMMVDAEAENPEEMEAGDCIKSSLLILEPYPGELGLTMPKKLITKIAAALYGLSVDLGGARSIEKDYITETPNIMPMDMSRAHV